MTSVQLTRMSLAEGGCSLPKIFGSLAVMTSTEDLEHFGNVVRARREELGIQQEEMSDHGGPSSTTMSRIERGIAPPSPKTLRKLDSGLQWKPGSAKRALAGGEPEPLPREAPSLPPLSNVDPFRGVDSLRWRMVIERKPDAERTEEERAWLAASSAEQTRLAQLGQAQSAEEWPAASRQPEWSNFKTRSFEEIFNEWQVARARLLDLQLEYAIGRRISPERAAKELSDVLRMAIDSQDGRPWTPPWDPGAEFLPGEEPWKGEWWVTTEEVPAPEGLPGTITQISWADWDVERVRAYHAKVEAEPSMPSSDDSKAGGSWGGLDPASDDWGEHTDKRSHLGEA